MGEGGKHYKNYAYEDFSYMYVQYTILHNG